MPFVGNNLFLARDSGDPKAKTGQQGPSKPQRNRVMSGRSDLPGFPLNPAATYETFDEMDHDNTIFLVKNIVTAPVRRNTWNWQKKKGTNQKWLDFCKETLDPLRMAAVRDGLRALSFESSFFELIAGRVEGKTTVVRMKQLADYPQTTIWADDGGNILGLENKGANHDGIEGKKVKLKNRDCFIYRNEPTVRRPYGQSRNENVIKDWARSEHIGENLAQYLGKVAGIVIQCHYPDGTGLDANGAPRPNFWLAEDLLREVGAGRSVAIPNKFASFLGGDENGMITPAILEKALASAGKSDWVLSAFDPGGTDFTKGFLDALAYYDKRIFRGWGRGERSGLEATAGGMGTSDAGTHTDTGMLDSELIDQDFAAAFSKGVIDKVLMENWGPQAAGQVWVEPAPLVDTTVDVAQKLLNVAMGSPVLAEVVGSMLDWDKIAEDASVPLATHLNTAFAKAMAATKAAAANPKTSGAVKDQVQQMGKVNGNGANGSNRIKQLT